jgi:hypothetical protein
MNENIVLADSKCLIMLHVKHINIILYFKDHQTNNGKALKGVRTLIE